MTFTKWLAWARRFLSGREGLERQNPPPKPPIVELPEIESPHRPAAPLNGKEREHLERKRTEHDMELERLRAIALARVLQRDT